MEEVEESLKDPEGKAKKIRRNLLKTDVPKSSFDSGEFFKNKELEQAFNASFKNDEKRRISGFNDTQVKSPLLPDRKNASSVTEG